MDLTLTGLSFENYKAFAQREEVEIRPLTLLIGRNSSGKSAIARLPLLLTRALAEGAQAPVDLSLDEIDFGGSFVDLIHNRRPHGAITLGATFTEEGGACSTFHARIQHYSDLEMQVVDRFAVTQPGEPRVVLTRDEAVDPRDKEAPHRLEVNGASPLTTTVRFDGIWPFPGKLAGAGTEATRVWARLGALVPRLRAAVASFGYLGPFRHAPARQYRLPGGQPQHVGTRGISAPALLGADSLRMGGVVVQAVGEWYREHLGGWILDVTRQGSSFSLILRSPDDPSVEVNLVDAGTGLSQVLAIVVQRKFEAQTGSGGGVEIVEQPELHLHPGAHGDLADLYIEAARQPGFRFIVETHSENFILRVRRRIAEGTLSPEHVALYWVDDSARPGSCVKHIPIHSNGDVADWPRRVFSEDFEEVKAIRAAQRGAT